MSSARFVTSSASANCGKSFGGTNEHTSMSRTPAATSAVIQAGFRSVGIVARNGPGVVVASYGVMASGAAEFVVDLNLGSEDIVYAMRILRVRRAVVERGELPRVANLGLDVLALEEILACPARSLSAP